MAEAFEIGDVVQLKSGGETMTVERSDSSTTSVVWMDDKKVVRREEFVTATLDKYEGGSAFFLA